MTTTTEFKSFESIAEAAKEVVSRSGEQYTINFSGHYRFSVALLKEPQLLDVVDKARAWQAQNRPSSLHFSHGEYIGEHGLEHVASELARKRDSNRALISLISQKDIVASGDRPIPSFLVYQCGIEGNILFVTVYYRALELSKFFRINLEEIRLMTNYIYSRLLTFQTIHLNVIAFRAYIQPAMNTLEKCKLDQLGAIELLKIVEKDPHQLPELLREKGLHATVISLTPLSCLRGIFLDPKLEPDIPFRFNRERYISLLDSAIAVGGELAALRTKASHHPEATEKALRFRELLETIAREVETCLSS